MGRCNAMPIIIWCCLWLLLGCGLAQAQLRAVQVAAGAAPAISANAA